MPVERTEEERREAEGWPMLEEWPPPVTTHIRSHDYYGGDVWVDAQPGWLGSTGTVVIRWRAWGGYGAAALQLSPDEVAAIALAAAPAATESEPPSS